MWDGRQETLNLIHNLTAAKQANVARNATLTLSVPTKSFIAVARKKNKLERARTISYRNLKRGSVATKPKQHNRNFHPNRRQTATLRK